MKALRWLPVLSLMAMAPGVTSCVVEDDCNYCSDPWVLNYCDDAGDYVADCHVSCRTDPAVYMDTCGAPAAVGECDDADGICLCYCQDAFDSCNGDLVTYTRDGVTYEADCKDVCPGGTCDPNAAACAC